MYQLLVTTSLKTFSNEACGLRTDVLKFDDERAADVAYKQIQESRGGSAYDYRHVVKLY